MGEGGRRSRVGKVVCRNVNGLNRRNRTGLRGRNALLEVAHLGSEGGLIAYCGRHTAEKCGNLGTCLGEAEDVVDEQQNVLALITEVLSLGQSSQTDAQTRSRRLVHLAVNQAGLVDNAGLAHLQEQVGTLTSTLAYAGEHGRTAMLLSTRLLISSWIRTVLPTPAPPNKPVLPPRRRARAGRWHLMPVSKISVLVASSS